MFHKSPYSSNALGMSSAREKAQGVPLTIPAPSGGMNTRSNYLELPPTKARFLENFIPTTGRCTVRPGYDEFCTLGSSTAALSLMEYKGETGTTMLAVADDGNVYSTSSGSSSSLGTGYTVTAPFSYENMGGYLVAVNGSDTPFRYDGSTLSGTSLTGVTLTTLRTVKKVKERLWFTVNNSASPWYGPISGVAGTLTKFDLKQVASGGKCLGVFPWQGNTVFVLSTGEVHIYAGDPSTDFARVGDPYMMPRPVGYDAAVKVGQDLILMTEVGPIPMQFVAAGLAFDADSLLTWSDIQPSWSDDFTLYGSTAGWNAKYHGGMVYFNIPTSATTAKQYVNNLNVPAGAWTTYSELPAGEWAHTADGIFFTDKSSGRVCQHTGALDDGDEVVAIARPGFSLPSQGQKAMQFTLAKLAYDATGTAAAQVVMDVDFRSTDFLSTDVELSLEGGGGAWDAAWNSAWGTPAITQLRWQKVKGYGKAVAPAVRVRNSADSFKWYAVEVMTAPGGVL